ncbi:MAG: hypothetical protein JW955_18115 [Sedimentisphaerales bacterium]|nr:hypothetical protein [Sedimentisphaerales bacterium]
MELTRDDQGAVEKLRQLAEENRIDIAGGKMRRTSSRFCLGVEHSDCSGTRLSHVGVNRFGADGENTCRQMAKPTG